ncbi:MAG: polysaccharide biosynthesis protein, partial [Nitrospiraceae bacterium]|nr:polysaccharide biosynthesis protein [Nitrospiraceae bacterium]
LVLKSLTLAKGGEVFVTKMPVVRISDLAEAMVELLAPGFGRRASDIGTVEIGAKPGEKLYEELVSGEEILRSVELDDMFVITPAFKGIYQSINYEYAGAVSPEAARGSYVSLSKEPLDKDDIKEYLVENGILENAEEYFYRALV